MTSTTRLLGTTDLTTPRGGFFYRATLGTFVNVITGRSRIKDLGRNLAAAIRFPLSQWGLCTDPWKNFSRYAEIEAGLGATYFVIPFADRPGRRRTGAAPAKRAARYTVEEVKPELDRASQAGCEIALHGIDAWFDAKSASVERARVAAAGLARPEGVRMHWLYFDSESPQSLDDSGFTYDSTFGYNATVGYRAGTLQVFRPPGVLKLLELPLHVMDTALFYPSYLHLRKAEAHLVLAGMIQQAAGFGGVLTFNWHDRSIAPERLWEEFYTETLRKLQARKTWFPTASKAVAWFQKRRSARIACDATRAGMLRVLASTKDDGTLPALTVRIHRPRAPGSRHAGDSALAHPFTDVKLEQQLDLEISL